MLLGVFFMITSIIGLIRIKDDYQMLHIAAINDMLGVPLFLGGLSGLCFINLQNILAIKIILLIVATYIVTPISGYIIIKILYFLNNKIDKQ
jgi:multicomponent Na+:H+ antiporter subunit G